MSVNPRENCYEQKKVLSEDPGINLSFKPPLLYSSIGIYRYLFAFFDLSPQWLQGSEGSDEGLVVPFTSIISSEMVSLWLIA